MIYFIQQGHFGPIKIGYSKNPQSRIGELQTAHHARLRFLGEIEGGISDERRLHEKFAAHRIRREWFAPSQDLIDYIRMALGANPFNDWFDGDNAEYQAEQREGPARSAPRQIRDLEIIPPAAPGSGWSVRSKTADLAVYETTLEDALWAFINDEEVIGRRFGWDLIRFPKDSVE
jgi:hypothetical protein